MFVIERHKNYDYQYDMNEHVVKLLRRMASEISNYKLLEEAKEPK